MIVNYDEVVRLIKMRFAINRCPLEEIEWVRDDGTKIEVNPKLIQEWKFIGLSNIDFPDFILSRIIAGEEKELFEDLKFM